MPVRAGMQPAGGGGRHVYPAALGTFALPVRPVITTGGRMSAVGNRSGMGGGPGMPGLPGMGPMGGMAGMPRMPGIGGFGGMPGHMVGMGGNGVTSNNMGGTAGVGSIVGGMSGLGGMMRGQPGGGYFPQFGVPPVAFNGAMPMLPRHNAGPAQAHRAAVRASAPAAR